MMSGTISVFLRNFRKIAHREECVICPESSREPRSLLGLGNGLLAVHTQRISAISPLVIPVGPHVAGAEAGTSGGVILVGLTREKYTP